MGPSFSKLISASHRYSLSLSLSCANPFREYKYFRVLVQGHFIGAYIYNNKCPLLLKSTKPIMPEQHEMENRLEFDTREPKQDHGRPRVCLLRHQCMD